MRPVAQLKDMLPGIELHHERMDGGGYPYGWRTNFHHGAIIAVADTFDAITTNRPYQSAMDLEFALNRIRLLAVTKFHRRGRRSRRRRQIRPHPPHCRTRRLVSALGEFAFIFFGGQRPY